MNRKEFIRNMGAAAGVAALGLGCSKEAAAGGTSDTDKVSAPAGKTAVVYFSWSGNTRFAATTIAKKAGAALFEIKAEKPYSSDFNKCCDEAKPECYGKKLRAIKPIEGLDLAKYDVVFVGTPDWWGTMAPPVRTWVTQNKDALKGKTVCIFQTHGGGGMERVGKEFAEVIGDAAKILPPKAFPGSSIKSATKALEAFVTDRLAVK
ncbi:MAG: flavodoxin [Kiritimatiellae bacterium]|nr:flavodoxin [Kiritimatiellia bacterium]